MEVNFYGIMSAIDESKERDGLVKLHLLIEGSSQIELTHFTIKTFHKRRQTSRGDLAYPHIHKPYIMLEGIIDLYTASIEKQHALALAQWALVPADDKDAYRKVALTSYIKERIDEQITFERGFILDYEEKFIDDVGTKSIKITLAEAAEFID